MLPLILQGVSADVLCKKLSSLVKPVSRFDIQTICRIHAIPAAKSSMYMIYWLFLGLVSVGAMADIKRSCAKMVIAAACWLLNNKCLE